MATLVHGQVTKLQMLKEDDHVDVLRNALSHHEIIVVTEEPVIEFASLGFFSSTCVTNVGLLAKNGGILSVVCSSVANPIVPGDWKRDGDHISTSWHRSSERICRGVHV